MLASSPLASAQQQASCRSRLRSVWVQNNKLIKAANRPASSKRSSAVGGSSKKTELSAERQCDPDFLPSRQIGPVEVATKSGRGRCVVAKEDVRPGSLLFVSQAVGSVAQGQLGQQLQPQDLSSHWQQSSNKLTAADRYKLSLLHRAGGSQAAAPAVTFKSLQDDKASSKAKKAAASSKGFGAAAAKPQAGGGAAAAAAAGGTSELSQEQVDAVLQMNAYGDDHLDGGLTACRREQQHSVIGVWPEFSLMNHSCAPNTVQPVLLRDRLLLRASIAVPAGEELTTSYLGLAGGMPLQQRRALLAQHYGFECGCPRCKAEEAAPADVQATLQAMHAWSSSIDTPQLLQAMAQGDTAAVQQVHDKANSLVQQLEQQLQAQVSEPVLVSWLRAGGYDTFALLVRAADWLSGMQDLHAAQRLADLVRVFAPASEPHLMLLADAAVASEEAAKAGRTLAPEDSRELRVQRFVQTLMLRYGEVKDMDVLTALASAATSSLGGSWLGLQDINGQLGLDRLKQAAAAAGGVGEGTDGSGSRRKVELNLGQLGLLAQQPQQQQPAPEG